MISVLPVSSPRDLQRFIEYPYKKYANQPNWVPPLRRSEKEKFDKTKHPFYEHANMTLFLAERNNKVVGRIAVIDDEFHNEIHHENLLFFGFFEAEDADSAEQLYKVVEAHAAKLGRGRIRGPVNPSMNDGAGFQVDAFDTLPYIMTPQNPAEYPIWTEKAGYKKVKDLYAWRFDATSGLSERLTMVAERVKKRYKLSFRGLSMKRYNEDVDKLLSFYNDVWQDNWGQIAYTDKEAKQLAKDMKPIVDPEMIIFMELEGQLAGLAVGFPDANQVLVKVRNGKLFPSGLIHFLNKRMLIDRIRLPILGITPDFRNKGLEAVLIKEFFDRGLKRDYKAAECSWVLEDNEAMNKGIKLAGGELYKTYRLYQKELI